MVYSFGMASKKSPNDGKGSKAQLAALNKSKGVKPTAAVTKPGQKATGLAKSTVKDRFASTAKTPVKKATSGFAGSGMPLGASMGVNPLNKGQIANAVVAAGAGASIGKSIAKKTAEKVMLENFAKTIKKGIKKGSQQPVVRGVSLPRGNSIPRKSNDLLPGNSGPRWKHD